MRINGEWLVCDDGIVRPVIRGEVLATNGSWVPVPFLLDTGADRTVFSAAILAALNPRAFSTSERLSGLGGTVRTVGIETRVRLSHEESRKVVFRGSYARMVKIFKTAFHSWQSISGNSNRRSFKRTAGAFPANSPAADPGSVRSVLYYSSRPLTHGARPYQR